MTKVNQFGETEEEVQEREYNEKRKPVRRWETVDEQGNVIASGWEDKEGNAV